jgi:hypothetical protein
LVVFAELLLSLFLADLPNSLLDVLLKLAQSGRLLLLQLTNHGFLLFRCFLAGKNSSRIINQQFQTLASCGLNLYCSKCANCENICTLERPILQIQHKLRSQHRQEQIS